MGLTIGEQLEAPLKARKPSKSLSSAQAGANVQDLDSYAAGLIGSQGQGQSTDTFDEPISLSLTPSGSSPMVSNRARSSSTSAMTQSPADMAKSGVNPTAAAAMEAQKPLIEAESRNYAADTALKEANLEEKQASNQRTKSLRFDHNISGGAIKSAPNRNPGELSERRIGADGKAIVSTPRLDAAGMKSPGQSSSLADQRMRYAMRNRNAAQLAASPAVQAAKNRVVQETLAQKAQQIAGKVNGANPQARANSLAGMPGVNGVVINEGGKMYSGGAGKNPGDVASANIATINSAATPKFQPPALPTTPAPAAPTVASAPPSFAAPAVGPVVVQRTPQTPARNPGADFMDSTVARLPSSSAAPNAGDAQAAAMFGGLNEPYVEKLGKAAVGVGKAVGAVNAVRKSAVQSVSGAIADARSKPLIPTRQPTPIRPVTTQATTPSGRPMNGIADNSPEFNAAKATVRSQPIPAVPNRPPTQNAMQAPLRPRRVSQSAIVNPRVNPMFKTAVD